MQFEVYLFSPKRGSGPVEWGKELRRQGPHGAAGTIYRRA